MDTNTLDLRRIFDDFFDKVDASFSAPGFMGDIIDGDDAIFHCLLGGFPGPKRLGLVVCIDPVGPFTFCDDDADGCWNGSVWLREYGWRLWDGRPRNMVRETTRN